MNSVIQIIIPSIISVIGILVTIVITRRARREKRPIWFYKTKRIIGEGEKASDDIKILFREKTVPQVSVTKMGFVNLGKQTIINSDIKKPIIFSFSDDELILKEPEVKPSSDPKAKSRSGIDFYAHLKGNAVKISFDHLHHLEGAIVEITHTGNEDSKIELDSGDINDVREIEQISHSYALTKKRNEWLLSLVTLSAFTIYLLWAFISVTISDVAQGRIDIWFTTIVALAIGAVLYGFIKVTLNWMRRMPRWLRIED